MQTRNQHGAAIITALLVVMLAATVATILLARQSEALTRTARAIERSQLMLFANTTLAWARSALLVQQQNSTYIALNQPWAQGLVARPIESASAAGLLRDAQAKFNLNNLIGADGRRRAEDSEIFVRLLETLKLDPGIADAIVDWLDSDDDVSTPGGAENGYYWSRQPAFRAANRAIFSMDELHRVKGIDDKIFAALSQYVTALPPVAGNERSKININTTSRELLQAVLPTVSAEEITNILRLREIAPFSSTGSEVGGIKDRKALPPALVDAFLDVKSRHFEAALAITGEAAQVRMAAMLQLQAPPPGAIASIAPAIIWVKEQ